MRMGSSNSMQRGVLVSAKLEKSEWKKEMEAYFFEQYEHRKRGEKKNSQDYQRLVKRKMSKDQVAAALEDGKEEEETSTLLIRKLDKTS